MLDGLIGNALDMNLHQGYYESPMEVYKLFDDMIMDNEDCVKAFETDGKLMASPLYPMYGDLLIHWLVTRKNIEECINIPFQGSLKTIAWAYINALFTDNFKNMLDEKDFIHLVKGLHGILDVSVQHRYSLDNFISGKKSTDTTTSANISNKGPSLLQQCCNRNKVAEKSKAQTYDKDKVKHILDMASQLSNSLDIPITKAFDTAENILTLSQP
ncbi:hypothetical protein AX15_006635 [Amanita polypyramis BW_CC]|nr:hypothetical protein AX15_006635 [Amanita polypyramis BW_CC]